MSAYLVDPGTIDLLLTAAPDRTVDRALRDAYPHATDLPSDPGEARSMLGRYLWCMNARSVAYRYPSDDLESLPGTHPDEWLSGMAYHPMPAYEYRRTRIGAHGHGSLSGMSAGDARRVIGAAHCFRYQSCELPEWDDTAAARFVSAVIDHAAHALSDGWEYTRQEDGAAPVSVLSMVG